ncbi:hypothetical protein WJX74_010904 [Apatococcus lobatus]|uniref:Cytochrome P450 n=1 Tax=Apatococcus lobatus TaxID=904363 RepID=A0AAW1QJH1_9CHLO
MSARCSKSRLQSRLLLVNQGDAYFGNAIECHLRAKKGEGSRPQRHQALCSYHFCRPGAFSSLAGDVFVHHHSSCHKTHTAWSRLGSVVGLRLGPIPLVMVTDAELARTVLDEPKSSAYTDLQAIYSNNKASLFTNRHDSPSTSQYYKAIRRQIAPAFNTSNLKQSFGRLAALMDSAVDYIHHKGSGQSVDIFTIAGRVTMNAISLAIFGEDLKGNEGNWEVRPEYACIFEPAMKWVLDVAAVAWIRNLTFIPAVRQKESELKQLQQEHVKMLKQLRACNPLPASLGGHLLALTDPATGQPLTDGQLEAEMATFFFAGYDTSTSAITWTLALIAAHPEVQQQVASELAALGLLATPNQPSPKPLTWQALSNLDYLRKVIKESQRLQTVAATGSMRTLSKSMRLGGYELAEGTMVHVPFYPIHHHPDAWDRPEDFLPERFDDAGADFLPLNRLAAADRPDAQPLPQSTQSRTAEDGDLHGGSLFQESSNSHSQKDTAGRPSQVRRFLPFSYGHRSCVGQNLANMTMLTFIAAICANFGLALDPQMGGLEGLKECGAVALTLQPKSAMLLQCTPRKHAAAS